MTETLPADRLRVAVASKTGHQIDVHFGHAESFIIYEVDAASARAIEQRRVEHYCQGGYGDVEQRDVILRALADCSACFVARLGDGPRSRLEAAGIAPIDDYPYAAVGEALNDWYRRRGGRFARV